MKTQNKEQLDVLLVNPMFNRVFFDTPFLNVPLGLEYMQKALRNEGYRARICNLDYEEPGKRKKTANRRLHGEWMESRDSLSMLKSRVEDRNEKWWTDYEKTLKTYSPKVVGVGMVTPQYNAACMAARIARETLPDVKTVAGGIHSTALPEEVLSTGLFDAVAISEGERTIVRLADCFISGIGEIGGVNGICHEVDGNAVFTDPVDLIQNIDELPFPDRNCIVPPDSLIDTAKYSATIITSRGCPFKCTYCARQTLWMHNKVRYRSIGNIMEELQFLKRRFELSYFYILDDTFNVRKERVMEFCDELLSRRTGLKWYCYVRADRIDDEMVKHMKRAGLDWVYLGGESGSQEILDKMKRGIRVEQVRESAEILKRHGIGANCAIITGHPDETPETLGETETMIRELPVEKTMIYFMVPYPGSEMYSQMKEEDRVTTFDWFFYSMFYPDLIRRAGISNEELAGTVRRIYDYLDVRHRRGRSRLLHPSFILEKLRTVQSASRLRHLAKRLLDEIRAKF